MATYSFFTIAAPSEGLYKEKGSKFLAFAFPVKSESEVKQHLERLKKQYFDARHHCFAWVLGPEREHHRAYDDGEPNHSAGDPILGQIRSRQLTDVLVVVVRYFGGTKLGVGGLISAYKTAADAALSNAEVVEVAVTQMCNITFPYHHTSEVMRVIKAFDLHIISQDYADSCTIVVDVWLKSRERFREKLDLLNATGSGINYSFNNE